MKIQHKEEIGYLPRFPASFEELIKMAQDRFGAKITKSARVFYYQDLENQQIEIQNNADIDRLATLMKGTGKYRAKIVIQNRKNKFSRTSKDSTLCNVLLGALNTIRTSINSKNPDIFAEAYRSKAINCSSCALKLKRNCQTCKNLEAKLLPENWPMILSFIEFFVNHMVIEPLINTIQSTTKDLDSQLTGESSVPSCESPADSTSNNSPNSIFMRSKENNSHLRNLEATLLDHANSASPILNEVSVGPRLELPVQKRKRILISLHKNIDTETFKLDDIVRNRRYSPSRVSSSSSSSTKLQTPEAAWISNVPYNHKLVIFDTSTPKIKGRHVFFKLRNESSFSLPKGLKVMLLDRNNRFLKEFIAENQILPGKSLYLSYDLKMEEHKENNIRIGINWTDEERKTVYFSEILGKQIKRI